MAMVSLRAIKGACDFFRERKQRLHQAPPLPDWHSTRNTPTSAAGNCLASAGAEFFGLILPQRVDHQAGFDLLVAAAQFLFHRYRLAGRIDRGPDFARRDRRILHQGVG